MVLIPSGSYFRGSAKNVVGYWENQSPVTRISIGYDFGMSRAEITQAQWKKLMGFNPSKHKDCDSCPVENVSWEEAAEYTQQLSERTGKRYRLPSESEWEYACRANQRFDLCGSDSPHETAWYAKNSNWETHAVSGKMPNAFGLHDMSGNVAEWVEDCYDGNYFFQKPTNGSAYTKSKCSKHVVKGGAFQDVADDGRLRAAYRDGWSSGYGDGYGNIGFRVVKEVDHSRLGEDITIRKHIPLPDGGYIAIYSDGMIACFDHGDSVTTGSACKRPSLEDEERYIGQDGQRLENMKADAGRMLVEMVRDREAAKKNKEMELQAEEQKRGTVEYCLAPISPGEIQVRVAPNWTTIIGFVVGVDGKDSQHSKKFRVRAYDGDATQGMANYEYSGRLTGAVQLILDKYKQRYAPNAKRWFSQHECN